MKSFVMRGLCLFVFFTLLIFLFQSCKKDKNTLSEENIAPSEQQINPSPTKNYNLTNLMNWESPTNAQLQTVGRRILKTSSYKEVINFSVRNGKLDWTEARLIQNFENDDFLMSIPSVYEEVITGVLFVGVKNGQVSFFFTSLSALQLPLEELIERAGEDDAVLGVIGFLAHQQHRNGLSNITLMQHLQDPLLQELLTEEEGTKGNCLIEVTIIQPEEAAEEVIITHDPLGNELTPEESAAHSIIHGSQVSEFTTVYYFWAWCPDEDDQNGWDNNWTANTLREAPNGGGLSGTNGGNPAWEYFGNSWHENDPDCLLFFNHPHAEGIMSDLYNNLLAESCTQSSNYLIEHTMNSIYGNACSSINAQDDDSFPSSNDDYIDINELISEINNTLETNANYQAGQLVCEICEGDNMCMNDFAECDNESDVVNCVKEKLAERYGLSDEVADWLMDDENSDERDWVKTFVEERDDSDEAKEYANAILKLIKDGEDVRTDRSEELYDILSANPSALVEDCLTTYPVTYWNDLINLTIPSSCTERLNTLGTGFENQPIGVGDGDLVNLDYYSITLNQLPTAPDGSSFEDGGDFFNYFRQNLNDFISDDITSFHYFPAPNNDQALWESNNPLTTLFTIDIPVFANSATGDDGSVICSSYESCCWTFSTISTSTIGNVNDGYHPVSGNRAFGFIDNGNETYTIYTKAADRAKTHSVMQFLTVYLFFDLEQGEIYDGGHNCWVSLLDGIDNYTNTYGGEVISRDENTQGARVNAEIILNILASSEVITSLPCE